MRRGGPLRRWAWRTGFAVAIGLGLWFGAEASHIDATPVPLLALVLLVVTVAGLFVDTMASSGMAAWVARPPVDPRTRARDPRTGSHLHLLEAHLAARRPDSQLAARLLALADQRLRARRDLTIDSAEARRLLGSDLDQLRSAPESRLKPADVERFLSSIERL